MTRSSKPRRTRTPSADWADTPQKKKPAKKKSRAQKLRIIGGSMRGRTVIYHGADFTRPMKDSVRENLFNIIGPAIKGADVIDLFAGTGAVTFESLSRGASSATAVEKNRRAHGFLKSTAETLGVLSKTRLLLGDAFRLGPDLLGPRDGEDPTIDVPKILFLCPPYAMWESMGSQLRGLIRMGVENCPPGSLIVAETDKHYDEASFPAGDWDHRIYGGTRLSFLQPPALCGLRM